MSDAGGNGVAGGEGLMCVAEGVMLVCVYMFVY